MTVEVVEEVDNGCNYRGYGGYWAEAGVILHQFFQFTTNVAKTSGPHLHRRIYFHIRLKPRLH